jgi:hypothetical protein
MKTLGIAASIVGIITMGGRLLGMTANHEPVAVSAVVLLALALLLLGAWLFVVNPRWIKTSADAYSQRLLESLDVL